MIEGKKEVGKMNRGSGGLSSFISSHVVLGMWKPSSSETKLVVRGQEVGNRRTIKPKPTQSTPHIHHPKAALLACLLATLSYPFTPTFYPHFVSSVHNQYTNPIPLAPVRQTAVMCTYLPT